VAWGTSARLVTTAALASIISIRVVKIPFSWFSLIRISLCGTAAYALGMLLSGASISQGLLAGSAAVLCYVVMLAVTGDPSVRAAVALLRRQWAKRNRGI
jgi:hypothetical protein